MSRGVAWRLPCQWLAGNLVFMAVDVSTSLESMLEYIRLHSTLSVEDFLVERREAAGREAAEYEAWAQPHEK